MIKTELGIVSTTKTTLGNCLSIGGRSRPGSTNSFRGYNHSTGTGGTTTPIREPIDSCFKTGTLITLPDMQKVAIEVLCPGYTLTAFHIDGMIDESVEGWEKWASKKIKGEFTNVTVKQNIPGKYYYYFLILLTNGSKLEVTYEHPLLVFRDDVWQWVQVGNLLKTDRLLTEGLEQVGIVSIERIDQEESFWKLDVEETDTYFAGGILAHNAMEIKEAY